MPAALRAWWACDSSCLTPGHSERFQAPRRAAAGLSSSVRLRVGRRRGLASGAGAVSGVPQAAPVPVWFHADSPGLSSGSVPPLTALIAGCRVGTKLRLEDLSQIVRIVKDFVRGCPPAPARLGQPALEALTPCAIGPPLRPRADQNGEPRTCKADHQQDPKPMGFKETGHWRWRDRRFQRCMAGSWCPEGEWRCRRCRWCRDRGQEPNGPNPHGEGASIRVESPPWRLGGRRGFAGRACSPRAIRTCQAPGLASGIGMPGDGIDRG